MAGTTVVGTATAMRGSDVAQLLTQHGNVITDLEGFRAALTLLGVTRGMVLPAQTSVGLAVGTNAYDISTANTIFAQFNSGNVFAVTATANFAVSTSSAGVAVATVANLAHGALWVFIDANSVLDTQTAVLTETSTSDIQALASYAVGYAALPVLTTQIPIGVVFITASAGAHTWGTTSITGQTKTYVSFLGLPGVEVPLTTIALDTAAATFSYTGSSVFRLGSGVRIACAAHANVTVPAGTSVATGKTGAWLIYMKSTGVEYAQQLGAAYASLAVAQAAVRDHNPNPYLPVSAVMYVQNNSGVAFVPGTTNLDAQGVTTTFVIETAPAQGINAYTDLVAAAVAQS